MAVDGSQVANAALYLALVMLQLHARDVDVVLPALSFFWALARHAHATVAHSTLLPVVDAVSAVMDALQGGRWTRLLPFCCVCPPLLCFWNTCNSSGVC